MKKILKRIIFAAAAAMCINAVCAADGSDVISIYPDNVIKNSVSFGYGGDWNRYSFLFNNSESDDVSENWTLGLKRRDMKIPVYRMGGDSSNSFFWKTKIGDIADRTNNDFENKGYAEWYKALSQVTPEVKLNVVLNMNDTAHNNADLVRYLTLMPEDENAVCAEGINWAQVRADSGIADPVPVIAFELGNELYPKLNYDKITADEVTDAAAVYAEECAALIEVLRGVNPDINIAAQMYSSSMISYTDTEGTDKQENEARCRAWNRTVAERLKNVIDSVVHHDYFNIKTKTSNKIISKRDEEYKVITDYIDGTDIKILLTETGSYLSGGYNIKDSNSMKYALALGRFYIKVFSMDKIEEVIQYGFNNYEGSGTADIPNSAGETGGELWTSYRYCKDGIFRPSATGAVGNLFAHMSDGAPVMTDIQSTEKTSAQAFKTADGKINVIVIPDFENQNSDNEVNLVLPGYKAIKKTVVSGAETADNNSVTPNAVTTKTYRMNSENPSVTVPAYSAVGIEFVPAEQEYVSDEVGEINIKTAKCTAEITDCFYSGAYSGNNASLIIVSAGTEYTGTQPENIIASDYAEVIDDKVYFRTELPYNMLPGEYTAVIGTGGEYHKKNFMYGTQTFKSVTADCRDGVVTASAAFSQDAADGTYTVTAIYGSGNFTDLQTHRLAYAGTFEKTANVQEFTFRIPNEALSGTYTLTVGSNGDIAETTFEYTKNNETAVITGVPTDGNGNEITGLPQDGNITFTAKNISNETIDAAAYACCYRNGRLIYVSKSDGKTVPKGGEESFSVSCTAADADLIKIVIWDKSGNTPFTSAYYIK